MNRTADSPPLSVLVYGLLGIIPFWLLPMTELLAPSWTGVAVGLAMTPTLAGLAVLVFTHGETRVQLLALAAALTLSWGWDFIAKDAPPWYGRFRTVLTLGAVGGLCLGAMQVP